MGFRQKINTVVKSGARLITLATLFLLCASFHKVLPLDDGAANLDKKLLLELVNEYRKSGCNCGGTYFPPAPRLKWNDTLEEAAIGHVQDMSKRNRLSHTGRDGSSIGERIVRRRYSFSACAENIAKGHTTEEEVVQGWIKSTGHCRNIMNARYRDMGAAASGIYWVQIFAVH